MQKRVIGDDTVFPVGLGCMGMSEFYGPADEAESIRVMHHALDRGATFFDTADMYGSGHNEQLIGRAIRDRRDEVFLATKFAIQRGSDGGFAGISGRPEYVKKACEESLRRLRVDTIDLYYQHRVDPTVPIEDTVGAMSRLVEEGKVRFLGLSEAGTETIRRAGSVHRIAALQTEYSLWSRDAEDAHLSLTEELGVTFVSYSPLGRGFLTGQIRSLNDLAPDDYRRNSPRFQGDNFAKNLELVDAVRSFAEQKGCTPAQLALAWTMARWSHVVAIPGTRNIARLDENIAAMNVQLTPEDLSALDDVAPKGRAAGERYPEWGMKALNL
ncbi:MAG: aldo/keto reductase [Myxococcota bacterium]